MAQTSPELDHLIVAAATLEQGARWCEEVLGVQAGPGGQHPLMGTHNRLASLSTPAFARCYLEIIAIAPELQPQKPADQARWFDLDNPTLQHQLRTQGPQLLHWAARVPELTSALAQCEQHHIQAGEATQASRATPCGLLEWQIVTTHDGRLPAQRMWPTLISWGANHPSDHQPPSGLGLLALHVTHPNAAVLNALWRALGADHDRFVAGPAQLSATIASPRGPITLRSHA
jgi:hypothetical protein